MLRSFVKMQAAGYASSYKQMWLPALQLHDNKILDMLWHQQQPLLGNQQQFLKPQKRLGVGLQSFVKMHANFAAQWKVPVGSINFLSVPTHCSGCGAKKYLPATTSVSFAKTALRLSFSEDFRTVSGWFQTNLMASSTPVGLVTICRVIVWATAGQTGRMSKPEVSKQA